MPDLIGSFIWCTAAAINPIGIVYIAIGLKLSFSQANSYFIDNILKVLGLAIAPVSAMIISLNLKNRRTRKVTTNIALLHAASSIQPKYMKDVNGAESLSERMLYLLRLYAWGAAILATGTGCVYLVMGFQFTFSDANSYFMSNIDKVLEAATPAFAIAILALDLRNRRRNRYF